MIGSSTLLVRCCHCPTHSHTFLIDCPSVVSFWVLLGLQVPTLPSLVKHRTSNLSLLLLLQPLHNHLKGDERNQHRSRTEVHWFPHVETIVWVRKLLQQPFPFQRKIYQFRVRIEIYPTKDGSKWRSGSRSQNYTWLWRTISIISSIG